MSGRVTIRWTKPLAGLLTALGYELGRPTKPDMVVAELPRGAFVGLLRRDDGRREVFIGRLERASAFAEVLKWDQELRVFIKHLGLDGWVRGVRTGHRGMCAAFVEPVEIPTDQMELSE